ncbi:CBS domain-containing protein [Candidatus Bathyarchaeota archaeon]|nr:MAG: CBS domain-containing protein [Candidatus Bathyarchaeota archaeon]
MDLIRYLRRRCQFPERCEKWLVLDLLGAVAGIAGGLGAIVFRKMIAFNKWLFFDLLLPNISTEVFGFNYALIVIPALGGLIVGPIIMKFAPETKGHGVPEVMEAVALKGGRIRKRVALLKILVSSVTIGSGGSAGREGPIAQIGASIGSLLGEVFKLDSRDIRLLVVCGLSAGIAGTFNAPLGGALFGMEILYRGIGLFNAVPVVLASVIGAAVASAYLGAKPSFNASNLTFTNPSELIYYFVLGVVFGVLAVIWVKLFYLIEDGFAKLRVPDHYKPALGGLMTGFLGMLMPTYGIMGVGYEGVNQVLAGKIPLLLLLILGFSKMVATAFTIGSGGSGGIFAPSLYIGSMFGGALGLIFHQISPEVVTQPFTYSLAGMAALFAGAAQAPLNVMIMIPEMSDDYSLLPPLMVSSTTSFIVAWLFLRGSSIYTLKLERRGVKLRMGRAFILESIKVEEVMSREVTPVRAEMPLSALELLMEETRYHGFPVVERNRLIGIVTFRDIVKVPREERDKVKVKDILTKKLVVTYPDETVQEALDKMYRENVGRLPVVDRSNPHRLVGIITRSDIIRAYEIAITRIQE